MVVLMVVLVALYSREYNYYSYSGCVMIGMSRASLSSGVVLRFFL